MKLKPANRLFSIITLGIILSHLVVNNSLIASDDKAPLRASVSYLEASPFIQNDRVFPETALAFNNPADWQSNGFIDGNALGVRPAQDPVTGSPVLEFWFKIGNPKSRWLNWVKNFPAALVRSNMKGVSLEVYPITPIPSSLWVELGLPLPTKDVGPAFLTRNIGQLTVGQWNHVEISEGDGRHLYPAGIRFTIDASAEDVPQNEEVRFLVRNFQLAPGSKLTSYPPNIPVVVNKPINAGYLQLTSPKEVLSGENVTLNLDVAISRPLQAHLNLEVSPDSPSSTSLIDHNSGIVVNLRPPVTHITINAGPVVNTASYQSNASIKVSMHGLDENQILHTENPFSIVVFDQNQFESKIASFTARLNALTNRAENLGKRGILVKEPKITLQVAELFLSKYIPDNFNVQKEHSIALTFLDQVGLLLDKASAELDRREALAFQERTIPYYYNASLPVEVKHGRLYQNGNALLLFGPQEDYHREATPLLSSLGFNQICYETEKAIFDDPTTAKVASTDAAKNGSALQLLFSTHYLNTLLPSGLASHVMLPYDILAPETRPALAKAYGRVLAPLSSQTNLIGVGTANEPGYMINAMAEDFENAFRDWLSRRDSGQIACTNKLWKSNYGKYADITLAKVFSQLSSNPAVSYDWETFRAYILGTHFRFMRDQVSHYLPGRMIWVKDYETLGFGQIDPEVLFDEGATIHDWSDIQNPMWTDYARGIDSLAPLSCSEWKLVPGFGRTSLDADPKAGTLLMFENFARGLSWGIVWKWEHYPWAAMGDTYSFTLYPTAMEGICRTSYRLQQLAPVFEKLSSLDGGKVALLFDKGSLLHQGEAAYQKNPQTGFEALYWDLDQNSAGVHIFHSGRVTAGDLSPRRLLVVGTANALPAQTMHLLRDWVVNEGGTLWLSLAGSLSLDPWGARYGDTSDSQSFGDLVQAAAEPGVHTLGEGTVVVDPKWTGYRQFLTGPLAIDSATKLPFKGEVECRLVGEPQESNGYFYVLNRSKEVRDVLFIDSVTGKPWTAPRGASDIWNEQKYLLPAKADTPLTLPPNSVMLFVFNRR